MAPAPQEAKKYCREVMGAVRDLRQTRDMSINEIKLTLAIEDPTVREQRDYLGIEVRPPTTSPAYRRQRHVGRLTVSCRVCSPPPRLQDGAGVSRDEIAAALLEVTAGRIPLDRLALRELWREIREWPYLNAAEELQAEQQAQADYEGITDTGALLWACCMPSTQAAVASKHPRLLLVWRRIGSTGTEPAAGKRRCAESTRKHELKQSKAAGRP